MWVVAQSSRGESLSKARWRIAGTILGCCVAVGLIAAFPQSPALFFGVLACWIGLCCGMATFLEGYKAYGLVLTGFTSAIVATGAIMQPDQVFDIAMARGTYIVLGVVCEALLALLFMPGLQAHARARLKTRLESAQALVRKRVTCLVEGHPTTELDQSPLLGELTAAGSRIEYDALEAGGYAIWPTMPVLHWRGCWLCWPGQKGWRPLSYCLPARCQHPSARMSAVLTNTCRPA